MTTSASVDNLATPQAGDVMFVYSKGKDALWSCLIQRFGLKSSNRLGRWFSHVAIALNDRIAIEASTAPEEGESTWSGVTLDKGVRLQLLPDLFFSAKQVVILRHPTGASDAAAFGIDTPHVSLLLGSGYSTSPLKKEYPALAGLPDWLFNWKAEPDTIAQQLRDDPKLRADIESRLSQGEACSATKDHFCSEVAGTLLCRGKLLDNDPGIITPRALFDLLIAGGWQDVTDTAYGTATQSHWKQKSLSEWQLDYRGTVSFAKFCRDKTLCSPMFNIIDETFKNFSSRLDAEVRRLNERNQKT